MRRIIILSILSAFFMAMNFCINCSNPLDVEHMNIPERFTDIDTIYNLDTVNISDTTTIVDTVIVVVHDSSGSQILCSRIASNQPEIVWMFRNVEGPYLLEFVAFTEEEQPTQKLIVDIDGEEYKWTPASDPEFILNMHLNQNAMIYISSKTPRALGHAIYICLTISGL
ncbi:MAG: hypothetical protein AB1746_07500 [Candidatus Zixiibacteriota bacterium]